MFNDISGYYLNRLEVGSVAGSRNHVLRRV